MNRVVIGTLLCLTALILLHRNQWLIGLACFVSGFLLMNRRR
ncbi:hypothetical protein [Desulfofustis limnaeus]|jgi:hypothetical protein|nr:hypothetical protein [Desulfofustis limnaeus]MDX9894474.1 hypothetical protein [Desulfofustis sp.]